MSKTIVRIIIAALLIMVMTDSLYALTFEFRKDKPGVKDFLSKNLHFSVGGENIISRLPSTFYVITYFPDDIPVIAYKGAAIHPDRISVWKNAKNIKGPHGTKIIYNPNRPPEKMLISSYVLWDGWVFTGNKKETLQNLLKLYKSPSDVAKTDTLTPSFKEWKEGGIRFWGVIQTSTSPMSLTIRRRLVAVKSPYEGKINSSGGSIIYEVYIGDYGAAQGQIIKSK